MKLIIIQKERNLQYKLLKSINRMPETYPDSWAKLTHAQKAHVYRKMKECDALLQSSGLWVARKVKSKTTIERLKAAGFDVVRGVVLIPRESVNDKIAVNAKSVTLTRKDGSFKQFLLGTKDVAGDLKLPPMKPGQRIGLNLGNGNTNGSRNVSQFQKNYSVPSGAVSRDDSGNSIFTGNEGDNMVIYGWVVSTSEKVKRSDDPDFASMEKAEFEERQLARKMRKSFKIGR